MSLDELKTRLIKLFPLILIGSLALGVATFIYTNFINTGVLKVESSPSGAQVKLNSTDTYVSPTEITGLRSGKYQVEVSSEGFTTQTREVSIQGGQTTPLTAVLLAKVSSEKVIGSIWVGDELRYAVALANGTFELWTYQIGQNNKIYSSSIRSSRVIWSKKGDALVIDSFDTPFIFSGGVLRQLPIKGSGFSWNAEGTKLAYFSDRFLAPTHPQGLNTYDIASGQIANIFSDREVSSRQTQWSPDGTKILYHEDSLEEGGDIFIVDLADRGKNKTFPTGQAYGVSWAPDSSQIAYLIGSSLFTLNLSEAPAKKVFGAVALESVSYTWSSTSSLIVAAGGQEQGSLVSLAGSSLVEISVGDFLAQPGGLSSQGNNFSVSTKSGLFMGKL